MSYTGECILVEALIENKDERVLPIGSRRQAFG